MFDNKWVATAVLRKAREAELTAEAKVNLNAWSPERFF